MADVRSARFWPAHFLAGLVAVLASSPARAEVSTTEGADLRRAAKRVAAGGALRVEGVRLDERRPDAALELSRFEVWAPNAEIIVQGEKGGTHLRAPANLYFQGRIAGDPRSRVLLTVRAHGGVRGIVSIAGRFWLMEASDVEGPSSSLAVKPAPEAQGQPFACEADALLDPRRAAADPSHEPVPRALADAPAYAPAYAPITHTARVAVETDHEFFLKFGSVADATDYVGDLFAYASTIYEDEVATELVVSYLSLWSTPSDPWTQPGSAGSGASLDEFTTYWNQNRTGVSRTIAHFLSGRATGGGVAYVSALCSPSAGYGFSGSLSGSFNIDNPQVVWDILVVSHEIGHNFGSPHTHDYCGYGGSASPVDSCFEGCLTGAALTLPGVNSLTGGTSGQGDGTIMSYCHLRSGSYGNITLTFGAGHSYGILAQRVPEQMRAHVLSQAQSNPACLSLDLIFRDAF